MKATTKTETELLASLAGLTSDASLLTLEVSDADEYGCRTARVRYSELAPYAYQRGFTAGMAVIGTSRIGSGRLTTRCQFYVSYSTGGDYKRVSRSTFFTFLRLELDSLRRRAAALVMQAEAEAEATEEVALPPLPRPTDLAFTPLPGRLVNGQIVRVYGKEFTATNVRPAINGHGETVPGVFHYTGTCTDDPCNDDIRHTGYNGGTYSWRADGL